MLCNLVSLHHYLFVIGVLQNNLNSIFSEFKSNNIQNLILDLRYNPGGAIDNAVYLSSLITGQFNEEIFCSDQWNNEIQEFWLNNNPDNLIRRFQTYENSLFLNKIYILTSRSTASASELVINSLNPYIDVIHIGETTYGKYQGSLTLYDSENFSVENIMFKSGHISWTTAGRSVPLLSEG